MSAPPPVFANAQVALAGIVEALGLARVHDEYNEAAFGSADQRIARVLAAASAARSSRGGPPASAR